MSDKQFLMWVADRLVNVYNESENVDFVQKLRAIADNTNPYHNTHWSACRPFKDNV